jgi:hypothetical protein
MPRGLNVRTAGQLTPPPLTACRSDSPGRSRSAAKAMTSLAFMDQNPQPITDGHALILKRRAGAA